MRKTRSFPDESVTAWGGAPWAHRFALHVAAMIGLIALTAAPSQSASAARRSCVDLKGAAAKMFDQTALCKNLGDELGKSASSGRPMDWGKALGHSVRGKRHSATAPVKKVAKAAKPKASIKVRGHRGGASVKVKVRGVGEGHVRASVPRRPSGNGGLGLGHGRGGVTKHAASGAAASATTGAASPKRPSAAKPAPPSATAAPPAQPGIPPATATPRNAGRITKSAGPTATAIDSSPASNDTPLTGKIGRALFFALLMLGGGMALLRGPRLALATGLRLRRPSVPRSALETDNGVHAVERSRHRPVMITLGRRDGQDVKLDLVAAGGLQILGAGAFGAERVLLHRCLAEAAAGNMEVVAVEADLADLLDTAPGGLLLDQIPGLVLKPSLRAALDHVETELTRRAREREERELADATSAGGQAAIRTGPPLILLVDPQSGVLADRLKADLENGAAQGIGAILLTSYPTFATTVGTNEDGVITDASGPGAADLLGTRMDLLDAEEACRLIGAIENGELPGEQPEPSVLHGETPTVATTAVHALDLPPGQIRLLGQYSVEGPDDRVVVGRAKDAWALLGLLAEYRQTQLPRETVFAKLWPEMDPKSKAAADRFGSAIKEARAKLSQALDRPTGGGKALIQNVGASAYRTNPDFFGYDVWGLRDALADARAATGAERAEALGRAAEQYTGPFMPGLQQEWAENAARALDREIVEALVQLADLTTELERAVAYLERATTIETTTEHLYRRRMSIYGELGRIEAIHHCYEELNDHLRPLGLGPERQTIETHRRLTVRSERTD